MAEAGPLPKPGGRPSVAHGRARWLSAAMLAAVVLVSGTVVADVVLQYELSTRVGVDNITPFTWARGSNYNAASGIAVIGAATACSTGTLVGGNCYMLDAVVNGITSVPTLAANAFNFNLAEAVNGANANPFTLTSSQVTSPVAGTQGGTPVTCAFAILADAPVGIPRITAGNFYSVSFTTPGGGPCVATVTENGAVALNNGCNGAGSTVGLTTVNLITGATASVQGAGPGVWTCHGANGDAVGNTVLDVSYFIWAPTGSSLTGANVYVSPAIT